MMHPHTRLAFISESVGMGVVATRPIPRGTVLWVADSLDIVLPDRQVQDLPTLMREQLRRHAYLTASDEWVLCWDHARFVNHACQANTLPTDDGLELCVRDIQAGEQITNDYAFFNLAADESFDCACQCEDCRGHITGDNTTAIIARCQALVQATRPLIASLPQALLPLLLP